MGKKVFYRLFILCSFLCLIGCSSETVIQETVDNPFENKDLLEVGTINADEIVYYEYGIANQINEGENYYLIYDGGELEVDVGVSQCSKREFGIQIWIDGVAQAYRLEGETEYSYMHKFYFDSDRAEIIPCYLIPTVGEIGDNLQIEVSQFLYLSTQPDMVIKKNYTSARDIIEFSTVFSKIRYQANSEESSNKIETTMNILSTSVQTQELNVGQIENYLDKWGIAKGQEKTAFDNSYYYMIYLNDEDWYEKSSYIIDGKEKLKVRLEILGATNLSVCCTLYLNHEPLNCDWESAREISLEYGTALVLEAELDISKLQGLNELYAVIVPTNGLQFNMLLAQKTNSICLYHESDLPSVE